jgi:AraC-like DNA-binding protein
MFMSNTILTSLISELVVKSLYMFNYLKATTVNRGDQFKKRANAPEIFSAKTMDSLGIRIVRRHRFILSNPRLSQAEIRLQVVPIRSKYDLVRVDLSEKINHLMEKKKRYTDPSFNLEELACELGTNRTYMSRIINEEHRKRFNTYVNDYRFKELRRLLEHYPHLTREELANRSGFNSVTTMVRVIKQNTGMSYKDWKIKIRTAEGWTHFETELQEH